MEINLRRMEEYNSYNNGILNTLFESGRISKNEWMRGIKATQALSKIYRSVKGQELGSLKIIPISES